MAAQSTRTTCGERQHNFCENYDGEGACCARLTVQNTVAGSSESVGQVYDRCYNIDDIVTALDNGNTFVD